MLLGAGKVCRSTLSSIAIRRMPSASTIFAQSEANRAGLIIRNSRENESWLGKPCSRRMNRRGNFSLFFAQSAMSTQACPPRRLENTAIISIS